MAGDRTFDRLVPGTCGGQKQIIPCRPPTADQGGRAGGPVEEQSAPGPFREIKIRSLGPASRCVGACATSPVIRLTARPLCLIRPSSRSSTAPGSARSASFVSCVLDRTISRPHSLRPLFVLASAQCDQARLPYSTPSVALNTNSRGGRGQRCWRLCAILRGPAPLALILMVVMTTQFTKLLSFILANVHDPPMQPAYRLTCFSCMSQYLEEQYSYISYLYTKPQIFTDRCDEKLFDHRYLGYHNCTDMCITLRIDDRVGGRKRYGYLRGCMSDVLNYNDSTIRPFSYHDKCYHIRLRDLFARGSSLSYGFDESDHAHLCSCHNDRCNGATALSRTRYLTGFAALLALLSKYRLLFAH